MSTTIDDVAKECGLSRATVSRVLQNSPNVSKQARITVEKAIAKIGYQPNQMAQSLAQGYSNMVALIMGNISSYAQIEIAKTIQKTLYEHGFMVLLCNSDYNSQLCDEYLDTAIASKLAGAFLVTISATPEKMAQVIKNDLPIVMVNRHDAATYCDSVIADDEKAAYLAVKQLVSLGHTHIVLLSVSQTFIAGRNAYWGYRTALTESRIEFDESNVYTVDINAYSDVLNTRHTFNAAQVFRDHPSATAAVCLVNEIAVDFYSQCKGMGKSIPKDLNMVVLDPVQHADFQDFSFSTCGVSQQALGEAAASQMLHRIENRKSKKAEVETNPAVHIVLKPSYVDGSSTSKI